MFSDLTDRAIKAIRPTGRRVEYLDTKVPGLALRVTATGAMSWTVRYRHRGRLRRMTIGSRTKISLSSARSQARDLIQSVNKGADPAAQKQAGRNVETVAQLADLYLEKWARPRKRSWKADDNLLRRRVLPRWGRRAIVDIRRRDVRELVEGVAEAGAPVVANRLAALLSKLFAFAEDRELIEESPAVRIPRPGQEQERDRVFTEHEIRLLWVAFEKLDRAMSAFFKLRLMTAQRGGEVASMRWQDIDFDTGWWTIPATVAKNKMAHRVPLSAAVIDVLAGLLARAHKDSELVFEAHHRKAGAGARGKRQQAVAAATFPVDDFRGHDLRRTAASYMAAGGVPRLTTKKVLNHLDQDITAVYDRHSYDPEKRAALDWWTVKLLAIVGAKSAATVVQFVRAS